jgi:hypothetical protein
MHASWGLKVQEQHYDGVLRLWGPPLKSALSHGRSVFHHMPQTANNRHGGGAIWGDEVCAY